MNQHHGQSPQPHLYDRTALKTYLKRNESLPVDVFLAYLGAGGGSLVFVLCMAAAVFGSAGRTRWWPESGPWWSPFPAA